jgi:hypothetical protein
MAYGYIVNPYKRTVYGFYCQAPERRSRVATISASRLPVMEMFDE